MLSLNLDIFDLSILFFSWYVKPILLNQNFFVCIQFFLVCITIFLFKILLILWDNIFTPLLFALSSFKLISLFAVFFSIKFILLVALLVFVRGGIPRYRYDFLTKLGWIKTLSLVLAIFLVNLLLSYL